ncbi:hypothetical protein B0A55_11433 [Friedmanniomyces simplex]|uniref:Uncharacterized protein n=1 Tax=Friedmanniomyces simplex TaxID=329884 RepID=A0A4U0WRK1_9PEZI|nr:hypothetical protein B0A55_11433 [Friedmanniomyces simplex]
MEKQRKKTERENYGVRHTSYDNLGEGGKRERDGLIAGVQANWRLKLDNPLAFWPETLAPTSDGATLQLRHVSSSLLRELRPLSEATKGNIATAHRAMSEALANRLRRTGEKRKLIAEDLKEALRLCKTVRKRPRHEQVGQGAEQGPSSKRARRSGCISTEQPVSPVIESSTPAAQSHAAPSHHAEPQIPEDIHDSSTESDVEDAAVEPPEDLAHTSGVDGVEQSHNQVPTPPLSPEVLSHVWRRHRDTPVSQSVEISTDTDWSQKFEGLREPFYLMCMKADTVSKGKLVVTFSVDGGRPNAA